MGSQIIKLGGFRCHYHAAKDKRHSVKVVFVHHMWGSHKSPGRHYRLFTELGYDCISFDLLYGSKKKSPLLHPYQIYLYGGVFSIWKKQIEAILNDIEGEKILFGFSGPALSTLWAAGERRDIKFVICDGGPFTQVYANSKNLFHHVAGYNNTWVIAFLAFVGAVVWGVTPLRFLHQTLKKWPLNIPILSIRGAKDPIVSQDSIDEVFRQHPHLNLQIIVLPEGGHLDGLKNFENQYKEELLKFIQKHS